MILETIGLGAAGAAGLFGHVKTKEFVSRKLRYTKVAEKSASGMGLVAGAATAIAAAPGGGRAALRGCGRGAAGRARGGDGGGSGHQAGAGEVAGVP